ncbi:hypothetical protein BV22DRAFT_1030769 [Leucogyrophana mollusca]|uniref:Uncharacterized protein n=1 Tax=Leucogyrophana mollusca TaxID=85980 RepID=A0ACB8BSM2_9AGAM|nr:hypothetical protein BV22DRAFT_1030769 [Leucogyrophana mollusca]
MYYTQQTTSDTRNSLVMDAATSFQSKENSTPGTLPSIGSMSLPGFSNSPRDHQDFRGQLDPIFTSGPASQPYPPTHSYPSGLEFPSGTTPRPQYGADSSAALDYPDRDARYAPRHDPYYAPPRAQVLTSTMSTQLDPSLMLGQNAEFFTDASPTTAESSSSQSPAAGDEDSASRSRKSRREKPRIELAPDQPLTTQGKPRARVYVACVQCRTRKIRCDGAKPACHNCSRRSKATDECNYDAAPKRRGPDKTPGARQRMARDVRIESDGDAVATRRRRRKKHQSSGSANTRPDPIIDPNFLDEHPQPEPVPLPASAPPPVVDPSLTELPNFRSDPTVAPSTFQNLSLNSLDSSVVSGAVQGMSEDDMYRLTQSQHFNDFSLASDLDIGPLIPQYRDLPQAFITQFDEDGSESSEEITNITAEPSLDFTRKTWWDSLLALYSASSPGHLPVLNLSQRNQATNLVTNDLRFLFRTSNYWFSFINVPHFLANYFNGEKRDQMQPSLLPAALAIATFFQSSEAGLGKEGRDRALRLRDVAQGALEASLNAGWIDDSLAQAAWLLAMFEVCAHPLHNSERSSSAMLMLDMIIRTLALTFIDADDPNASKFSPRTVPSVIVPVESLSRFESFLPSASSFYPASSMPSYPLQSCSCVSLSLGKRWAGAHEHTPLWASCAAWDETASEADFRKEMCRRLCWSSLILTAGHSSYVASSGRSPPELFLVEPANYSILFPGETLGRSLHAPSAKDTIWSLICRTMLLWHSCLRIRHDPSATEAETARFGVNAWLEADNLEKALDAHTCGMERTFLFQGREFLFNVRMCISHEFQRYIPLATADANGLFNRKKAEEWLSHQANVAQRVVHGFHAVTGQPANTLMHRPFFAFWFMSQISRALTLWDCDNSLTLALDVCIALFKPVDYLSALWPCQEQRTRSKKLRERLIRACTIAGRPPPSPPPSEVSSSLAL